jgi:hypothetical protein
VTLTATVQSTGGGGIPSGSVFFLEGSTIIGEGKLVRGKASFTALSVPLGRDVLRALYRGIPRYFLPSTGTVVERVRPPKGPGRTPKRAIAQPGHGAGLKATDAVHRASGGGPDFVQTTAFIAAPVVLGTIVNTDSTGAGSSKALADTRHRRR